MERFVRGLLRELERRCTVLRERLEAIPADPDRADLVVGAYRVVESVRREVGGLLQNPAFRVPELLPNYLQLYRRWNEQATLVESFSLPFAERYNVVDRRLTRLARRLTQQVHWPLDGPLVAAFSSQYYWTPGVFNLVAAPSTEDTTLLRLPDLCHELGHILLIRNEGALIADFRDEIVRYVEGEKRRIEATQRPPEYGSLYDQLLIQWHEQWLWEFAADMVATFLVGPAFGWQHTRLCAGASRSMYFPALGELAEHPADEARLRGIVAALRELGQVEDAQNVQALWEVHTTIRGTVQRPADYDVCYPQSLLHSLAQRIVEGCRVLNIRGFVRGEDPAGDIPAMIVEAWRRFLENPQEYTGWEEATLAALQGELDSAPGDQR